MCAVSMLAANILMFQDKYHHLIPTYLCVIPTCWHVYSFGSIRYFHPSQNEFGCECCLIKVCFGWPSLTVILLKLMNYDVSLIITPLCVTNVVKLKKTWNMNINSAQMKLLSWPFKFGVGVYWIQEFIHVHNTKKSKGKHALIPNVITVKFDLTKGCPKLQYSSC